MWLKEDKLPTDVNKPPMTIPPSTYGHGPDGVIRPRPGVEGGIQRAVSVQAGDVIADDSVHIGEIAADEDASAIDRVVGGVNSDGIDGGIGSDGAEVGINIAVIEQLGDAVIGGAGDAGETAADENSPVGCVGRRTGKRLRHGINGIVSARAGVESRHPRRRRSSASRYIGG